MILQQIIALSMIVAMIIVLFVTIMKILDSVEAAEKEIESRRQNR